MLAFDSQDFKISGLRDGSSRAEASRGNGLPVTICAVVDAIRWAERIMEEIDRRHPLNRKDDLGGSRGERRSL
jgi:hypothetical protein